MRTIFLVLGLSVILLVAGILAIHFFGVPELPLQKGWRIVSPYQAEAKNFTSQIADIQSVEMEGEFGGDVYYFGTGLQNFFLQSVVKLSFIDDELKADANSFILFKSMEDRKYTLVAQLIRPSIEEFYFQTSKADIPQVIKESVGHFLNKWILVDKNLMRQILTEKDIYDFNEKRFFVVLREALREGQLFEFTRKISDTRFEFVVSPRNIALFLSKLIGDLSNNPFLQEEVSALEQSFLDYAIYGEVDMYPNGLPKEIEFDWNDFLGGKFIFKNYNQPTAISAPDKSESLEILLGQ